MAILPGRRLGPYEILSAIGVGGMGEVYKARDTRLDRIVAIKVLPTHLADRSELRERFDREAKTIASLNHPHICVLHDIGHQDGIDFLVMEYLEGETLAQRLQKGPLPIQQVLQYAIEISDALDKAHRKGVTHRDLKPGNIMLTKTGTKLLDFGLAKLTQEKPATPYSELPTQREGITAEGTILGTLQYMAPEQVEGKEADARTDIFAFGVVVYEMATGKKAFEGKSQASLIAKILETEPAPISSLQPMTPPTLDRLVKKCLSKEPEKRWQAASDVCDELKWIAELGQGPQAAMAVSGGTAKRGVRERLSWLVAAVAILVAVAIGVSFAHFREAPSAEPVLQLSVPVPGDAPAGFIAISPDGRRLLLTVLDAGNKRQLWLRPLDSPQFQVLAGTDNARAPFWSPDGKYIGFFLDGKLKVMPASGGPAQALCDGAGTNGGGTWNRDGVILFNSSGVDDPLRRVNAAGGECVAVLKPEAGIYYGFPEFLPDGKHFVYLADSTDESKRGVYLASLDNPSPRRILADDSVAMFAPSASGKKYGYLLFSRRGTLVAQPFNVGTVQTAGDVFPVAQEVSLDLNGNVAASVSATGALVYETNFASDYQTVWLDRSGKALSKVWEVVRGEQGIAPSPDGKTVAIARFEEDISAIWLYDLQRGGATRFTGDGLSADGPVWSPDGKYIAFGAGNGLYVKDASGGLKEELLLKNENQKLPSDWSRDGRYLIYTEVGPKGQGDIWYLPDPLSKSADRKPVLFQGTEAMESQGQLSPDSRWLAYVSNETGELQVYVRPFPSGPGRWKISASGVVSREPRWRPDGKELFYLENRPPNNRLLAAAVKPSMANEFQSSTPQALFEFRSIGFVPEENTFLYSPSADGQRFIVRVKPNNAPPAFNVITNWEKAALGNK